MVLARYPWNGIPACSHGVASTLVSDPFDVAGLVDGRVSDTKLDELLALQAELPVLDFKRLLDLTTRAAFLEFVKDVGAMAVYGGYLIGGVDDQGVPTGDMDHCAAADFDEARLVPRLNIYLPEPIALTSRLTQRNGHIVVLICIAAHPDGYAIFRADGQHQDRSGKTRIVFRQGEAYWRDGTRSVRITQAGMEQIIGRRIATAKVQ